MKIKRQIGASAQQRNDRVGGRSVRRSAASRLSPVGCWLRQAVKEVEEDQRERAAGRAGVLKVQSLDELFAELHGTMGLALGAKVESLV